MGLHSFLAFIGSVSVLLDNQRTQPPFRQDFLSAHDRPVAIRYMETMTDLDLAMVNHVMVNTPLVGFENWLLSLPHWLACGCPATDAPRLMERLFTARLHFPAGVFAWELCRRRGVLVEGVHHVELHGQTSAASAGPDAV